MVILISGAIIIVIFAINAQRINEFLSREKIWKEKREMRGRLI